uniref:Uncharacterized protein n=1 Tax=Anguilla anguilla TaxID=7936 RepID=A0A0E9QIY3_ANGAN
MGQFLLIVREVYFLTQRDHSVRECKYFIVPDTRWEATRHDVCE